MPLSTTPLPEGRLLAAEGLRVLVGRRRAKRRSPGCLADVPVHELRAAFATQSVRAIARRYGVTPSAVHYWRRKLGIRVPDPSPPSALP